MSTFKRFATKDTINSEIDWQDNAAAIRAFRDRIVGWYLEPIENWPQTGHEAFVALLATRQVVVTAATAFYGKDIGAKPWKDILFEVDEEFKKVGKISVDLLPSIGLLSLDDGTYAHRFIISVIWLPWGDLRMDRTEGISGTGKLATETEDGVLVFDPWAVRDRVREWFEAKCEALMAESEGEEAQQVCERLREAFVEEPS